MFCLFYKKHLIKKLFSFTVLFIFLKIFTPEYLNIILHYFTIKMFSLETFFLNKIFQIYIYYTYQITWFKAWFNFYLLYSTFLFWFILPLSSAIFISYNFIFCMRSHSQTYLSEKFFTFLKIIFINLICTLLLICYKYFFFNYINYSTIYFWVGNTCLIFLYGYELILHCNKTEYEKKNRRLLFLIFISALASNSVSFFYLM